MWKRTIPLIPSSAGSYVTRAAVPPAKGLHAARCAAPQRLRLWRFFGAAAVPSARAARWFLLLRRRYAARALRCARACFAHGSFYITAAIAGGVGQPKASLHAATRAWFMRG